MDRVYIPTHRDDRPDINERCKRVAEQTLAQFQRVTANSAFTRFIRLQQSLTNLDPNDSVLMHAVVSSQGLFPMVNIEAVNYPAFMPAREEVSIWTTQGSSFGSNLKHTIFHEGSHSVVDELTHWHPEGPFPMLDALVRAMDISPNGFDGNVSGLTKSLNHLVEHAARQLSKNPAERNNTISPAFSGFSNYGLREFVSRWNPQRPGRGFDQPFHGLQLFAGERRTDIASERWNELDKPEQWILQQFLFAADEALTDAVAARLAWGQSTQLGSELQVLIDSSLTSSADGAALVTRHWAHELLAEAALEDVARVDLELAGQAYESRKRKREAQNVRQSSLQVGRPLFFDSSSNQTLRNQYDSASMFQAPYLLPMAPAHRFAPLLGSSFPIRNERYWLLDFGSNGELRHSRYELNGRAIEPTFPVVAREPRTGAKIVGPGGEHSSDQRLNSALAIATVLVSNAFGTVQTPSTSIEAIASALYVSTDSRVLVTESALKRTLAAHEKTLEDRFMDSWIDGHLVELDDDFALLSLSLRTTTTAAVIMAKVIRSDADNWMEELQAAALHFAKKVLGITELRKHCEVVVRACVFEPLNAMQSQFSLPIGGVAELVRIHDPDTLLSAELVVDGLTGPELQNPLREVLLDEIARYVGDALGEEVDTILEPLIAPVDEVMEARVERQVAPALIPPGDLRALEARLTCIASKRTKHFEDALEGAPLQLIDGIAEEVRQEVLQHVEKVREVQEFVANNYNQIVDAARNCNENVLDRLAMSFEKVLGEDLVSVRTPEYRETDTIEIVWKLLRTPGIETLGIPLEHLEWSRPSVAVDTAQVDKGMTAGSSKREPKLKQGGIGI